MHCRTVNCDQAAQTAPPIKAAITDKGQTRTLGESFAAHPPPDSAFIDEQELLRRLPVSRRTLFNWRTTGRIPSVRLGGRRILFHWPSVEAALLRHQAGGLPS